MVYFIESYHSCDAIFSHPLRLGDRIQLLDKDFGWTGETEDISVF